MRFRFVASALVLLLAGVLPISWYAIDTIDASMAFWQDAEVGDALERSLRELDDPGTREEANRALVRYRQVGALQGPLKRQIVVVGLGILAITVALAAAVSVVLGAQLTRPLRSVAGAAQRIAEGDLGQSVPPSKIREVAALVDSFNEMVVGLRQSTEALARAERRAVWQDIARAIAHEIKNPLTPMRLTTQRLQEQHQLNRERFDETFQRSTEVILDEIDRLEQLANAFSSFARMPAPAMRPMDLREVVAGVSELFAADRERGVLSVDAPSDPVPIVGDPQQLEQVVVNLVKNGLEALDTADGRVRVGVGTRASESQATLTVTDDGPGIPENLLATIFQPYVSTKADGSGIGLAVVERVIADHQGRVAASNVAPRGAMFEICLPLAESGADDEVEL